MALTACTVAAKVAISPYEFFSVVPIKFVGSIGQGTTGVAQVGCLSRRRIRITWSCCTPALTTYTTGWRYKLEDAGPGSTLPVLSANAPIPGNVAGALGASINIANFFVNPAAARAQCPGGALIRTTDVHGTVQVDCVPGGGFLGFFVTKPYILYPWGARQPLDPPTTPGGPMIPGPIALRRNGYSGRAGLTLAGLLADGQLTYTADDDPTFVLSNEEIAADDANLE